MAGFIIMGGPLAPEWMAGLGHNTWPTSSEYAPHPKFLLYLLTIAFLCTELSCTQAFYRCTRVVDGDTIVVNIDGVKEKVRLIGVDTPETVHPTKPVEYFGKEASDFTKSMVEGKPVRLEYDWQKRDRYGRLLAYVYLEDGTFLNAEIVKQGYGFAYTRYPFRYLDEFRGFEKEARESGRGLWIQGR